MSTSERHKVGKSKPLLLYIDDDASNLEVMEMRLETRYEVLCAATDQDACKLFKTHGQGLSIVLMDVQLTGSRLDGIELVRLIRGTLDTSKIPSYARDVPVLRDVVVIFVTALGEKYQTEQLLGAGASAIVAKPVDFVKLSGAMTRHHLRKL